MPSTYSTNLRFELMATGEKSGTWGTISNTNIGTLIEQAISGVASVTHDDSASYSLTTGNGTSDEARNAVVVVTGTLTAARNLVVPSVDKLYVIKNSTSGGFNITVKTSAGTGVVVENGNTKVVFCDATNVEEAITEVDLNKLTASLLEVDNLKLDGNTISSTDTNGDITLDPNGTGKVNVVGELEADSLDIDGNGTIDGTLTITTADNNPQLIIKSTDADANDGPIFDLVRDSASPADNDAIGSIRWKADDSAANETQYADIRVFTDDVTDGTEDVNFTLRGILNGTLVSRLAFNASEMVINDSSNNVDFRVESDSDTHMLFVDAGNNRAGIKENAPDDTFDVDGTILSGVAATTGGPVFAQRYARNGPVGTGDYLGIISSHAGSGAFKIGYGLMATSSQDHASSYDNFSGGRSAVEFNQSTINFRNDTSDSSTTVGSAVTTQQLLQLDRSEATFNEDGNNIDFRVESNANTHMLFVDASGESVSLGTSNATAAQSNIAGGLSYKPAAQLEVSSLTTQAAFFNRTDSGNLIGFLRAGSSVGAISVTASGTTYHTTSDRRLKENIEPLVATDKLMAMNPVSYTWKAFPDEPRSMGFIAQEMAEVMPEAVSTNEHNGMMSMDYGRITPILVAALQESNKKIEQLEARIAELEAK